MGEPMEGQSMGMPFSVTEKPRRENDERAREYLIGLAGISDVPSEARLKNKYRLSDFTNDLPDTGWIMDKDFDESRMSKDVLVRIDADGTNHVIVPRHGDSAFTYARDSDHIIKKAKESGEPQLLELFVEPGKYCAMTVVKPNGREEIVKFYKKKDEPKPIPRVEPPKMPEPDAAVLEAWRIWVTDNYNNVSSSEDGKSGIRLSDLIMSLPNRGWNREPTDEDSAHGKFSCVDLNNTRHLISIDKVGDLDYSAAIKEGYLSEHSGPADVLLSSLKTTLSTCTVDVFVGGVRKRLVYDIKTT